MANLVRQYPVHCRLWLTRFRRELSKHPLPTEIKVYCPALDTRVKIEIPDTVGTDARFFTRRNIIDLCISPLKKHIDWSLVIQREYDAGNALELAWRMGSSLEWVRHQNEDEEINGKQETVFFGLALSSVSCFP